MSNDTTPTELVLWINSIIEENRVLREENYRLRLAAALKAYKPKGIRGRPKKIDVDSDVQLLEIVEAAMLQWGMNTRMAVLRDVIEKMPNKPISQTKREQKISTVNKRLSAANRLRKSSNK
jgi:hypothetical protein